MEFQSNFFRRRPLQVCLCISAYCIGTSNVVTVKDVHYKRCIFPSLPVHVLRSYRSSFNKLFIYRRNGAVFKACISIIILKFFLFCLQYRRWTFLFNFPSMSSDGSCQIATVKILCSGNKYVSTVLMPWNRKCMWCLNFANNDKQLL